jgi:hypothetical protein
MGLHRTSVDEWLWDNEALPCCKARSGPSGAGRGKAACRSTSLDTNEPEEVEAPCDCAVHATIFPCKELSSVACYHTKSVTYSFCTTTAKE